MLHYVYLSLYLGSGEDAKWQRVDPDNDDDNWVNITNLETKKYEVRVIATTGDGDTVKETRSRVWTVYVGQDSKYASDVSLAVQ